MQELIKKVEDWGKGQGIDKRDPLLQTTKILEEIIKLQQAIINCEKARIDYMVYSRNLQGIYAAESLKEIFKNVKKIKAAIGDIFITLVMLDIQVKSLDIVNIWKENCSKHHDVPDLGFTAQNHTAFLLREVASYQLNHNAYRYSGAEEVGAIIVRLSIIAKQQHLTLKECVDQAYNEVKDHKGKIVNGLW